MRNHGIKFTDAFLHTFAFGNIVQDNHASEGHAEKRHAEREIAMKRACQACNVDPQEPQMQTWLRRGLRPTLDNLSDGWTNVAE